MNPKANAVLDNLRTTLESQLSGKNLNDADLQEAEQKFCEDGLAFIKASGYELENFDECGPDEIAEALDGIAEDDESLAPKVAEFFELHGITEADDEEDEDEDEDGEEPDEDDSEDEDEGKKKKHKK
jgi:hypothetical protein